MYCIRIFNHFQTSYRILCVSCLTDIEIDTYTFLFFIQTFTNSFIQSYKFVLLPMEIIKSNKGGDKLYHKGYTYNLSVIKYNTVESAYTGH